jgi:hypothetical protein
VKEAWNQHECVFVHKRLTFSLKIQGGFVRFYMVLYDFVRCCMAL